MTCTIGSRARGAPAARRFYLWLVSVKAEYEDAPVLYDLILEILSGTPWNAQKLKESDWTSDR